MNGLSIWLDTALLPQCQMDDAFVELQKNDEAYHS